MTLRKVCFWLHLAAGTVAQIISWTDREYRYAPPSPGANRLAIEKPAALEAGFSRGRTIFVNPYTGVVLGEGSPKIRILFQTVTPLHRWLALAGENRAAGRAVTGACSLAFLFLIASGFYRRFPRKWTWQHIKPVFFFRGDLSGRARGNGGRPDKGGQFTLDRRTGQVFRVETFSTVNLGRQLRSWARLYIAERRAALLARPSPGSIEVMA
jgi:hypothetical protein